MVLTFIRRALRPVRRRLNGWRAAAAIGAFVFVTSWLAMWLVEPSDNQITQPANYWWYFFVTAATVGYGDFFPESDAGHVVGVYVIIGGIATLTMIFTAIVDYIQSARGRRMRGVADLDLDNHVVVLGYTPGRTERIVSELTSEHHLDVVLCAWDDVSEHPMPEQPAVHFVRGDLTHADLMTRACVPRARSAVIDGRDDNETLAIAVAVDHARPDVHMVVALRDLSRREQLSYVNPRVQCVQWHVPLMLTEEVIDPGITQVYTDMMTSGGRGNTYSVSLPRGFPHRTFGDCQTHFGRTYGATLLAIGTEGGVVVAPSWDRALEEGTTIFYLAGERIDATRLDAGH